jgi:hypothetical protein
LKKKIRITDLGKDGRMRKRTKERWREGSGFQFKRFLWGRWTKGTRGMREDKHVRGNFVGTS